MKIEVLLVNFTQKNIALFKECLTEDLYLLKNIRYKKNMSLLDYSPHLIILDNTNRNNNIALHSILSFKNDKFLRNTGIFLYGSIDDLDKKLLLYFDDVIEDNHDAHLIKAKISNMVKYYLDVGEARLKQKFENINFEEVEQMNDSRLLFISDDVRIPYEISGHMVEKVRTIEYAIFNNRYENFLSRYSYNFDLVLISGVASIHQLVFLYSQIKAHSNLKDSRILFVKRATDLIFLSDVMNLGINNYVNYPIYKKELIFQITVQLRNKKYLDMLRNEVLAHADSSWMDELTGLYNKKYLLHYFEDIQKDNKNDRNFSLIMIDVDNFKTINDINGHPIGDEVLKEVAQILKKELPDNIIVRFGGDEFLIVIVTKKGEKNLVLEKKLNKIIFNIEQRAKKKLFSKVKLKVNLSLGFASSLENSSILDILNQADKKMYEAKFVKKAKNEITSN